MSRTKKWLLRLGVLAVVPAAVAFASTSNPSGTCCGGNAPCCNERAPCCEKAGTKITCPITGEQIEESACPLCIGKK